MDNAFFTNPTVDLSLNERRQGQKGEYASGKYELHVE